MKKIIFILLLLLSISFTVAGIIVIILKLKSSPINIDYLSAVVFIIMGIFFGVLGYVLIKKRILE